MGALENQAEQTGLVNQVMVLNEMSTGKPEKTCAQ